MKAEDGKQSVEQYVKEVAKENGANIKIKSLFDLRLAKDWKRRKRTLLRKWRSRWECKP